jgi:glutaredoxin-like YruB-family protein
MNPLLLILFILSALAVVIGNLMLLVAAFRQSILWGLGSLFIPFVQLFFLIRHWDQAKKGFYVGLLGGLILMGTIVSLPNGAECLEGGWKNVLSGSLNGSAPTQNQIKELTGQIQLKRDGISKLESELSQATAALPGSYNEITAKRQALDLKDPAAVNQFNQDAAAYHQLNNQIKTLTQNLDTAKQELENLLNERSKKQAAGSLPTSAESKPAADSVPKTNGARRVVIYTTSHCGYCVKAKQYFAQKGISYQEFDVENSNTAREEFQRLGGSGVPLILVGDRRIEGFDRAALDQALQ